MSQGLSRRAMLRRLGTGAAATLIGIVAAARPDRRATGSVQAMNVCFWRKQATVCAGGLLREQWCHICCYGFECETEWCEWRVVGTC